ncbi:Ypt/Rab-GAP domain of gyp1p superfamily protein [Forsythia ovata]|uniref:Ypt/Rab-GAP domain of gyp1p superfamily protein n=1 Tax=Forsythia ovata TaxID=205694 RepID=A0ABD1TNZ1_9LAMI
MEAGSDDKLMGGKISDPESHSTKMDEFRNSITIDSEVDSLPDLQDQVVWLKVELCSLLEEKRSAMLRAEELEAALMEMVKQDNRRELSARIEQLELEVAELRQALADKKEQENAMLQVLLRVEQEQKVTEDARLFAEQDAAAQRYAVNVLQEKYEKAMTSLAQMEKRAVMAESMLEATLQYESGQNKALSSPRPGVVNVESPRNMPTRTGLLSFGIGWGDRNKGKTSNAVAPSENKTVNGGSDASRTQSHTNGHQE